MSETDLTTPEVENINMTTHLMPIGKRATLHGLEEWVKHQYTHLGWMALAAKYTFMSESDSNEYSHVDKVYSFLKTNERLCKEIKTRIESFKDTSGNVLKVQELNDLEILEHKSHCLMWFSYVLFSGINKEINENKNKNNNKTEMHNDMTEKLNDMLKMLQVRINNQTQLTGGAKRKTSKKTSKSMKKTSKSVKKLSKKTVKKASQSKKASKSKK